MLTAACRVHEGAVRDDGNRQMRNAGVHERRRRDGKVALRKNGGGAGVKLHSLNVYMCVHPSMAKYPSSYLSILPYTYAYVYLDLSIHI